MQELQVKLEQAGATAASQPTQQDSDKSDHLVQANRQFEDHVASIDMQLEQTQQELEQTQQELAQTQEELAISQAAVQEQTELVASQRAQHAQQQAQQAASKPLEEECVAKALQVRHYPYWLCAPYHTGSQPAIIATVSDAHCVTQVVRS